MSWRWLSSPIRRGAGTCSRARRAAGPRPRWVAVARRRDGSTPPSLAAGLADRPAPRALELTSNLEQAAAAGRTGRARRRRSIVRVLAFGRWRLRGIHGIDSAQVITVELGLERRRLRLRSSSPGSE